MQQHHQMHALMREQQITSAWNVILWQHEQKHRWRMNTAYARWFNYMSGHPIPANLMYADLAEEINKLKSPGGDRWSTYTLRATFDTLYGTYVAMQRTSTRSFESQPTNMIASGMAAKCKVFRLMKTYLQKMAEPDWDGLAPTVVK
jgi:hypothetical protein